jgi:hypothetical protein
VEGGSYLACQILRSGKELNRLQQSKLVAEALDTESVVVLVGVRIAVAGFPRLVFVEKENQAVDASLASGPVFQFRDRLVWFGGMKPYRWAKIPMPTAIPTVYLSSTKDDLLEYRAAVLQQIASMSLHELWVTPVGKWFPRAEMMAKALEIWPVHVIEEALGDDADVVLPRAIRCAELRVRLPRHHIEMLEYRAEQQETTVSGVLARELDGIASAHIEELSAALPGFAEAMAWPAG